MRPTEKGSVKIWMSRLLSWRKAAVEAHGKGHVGDVHPGVFEEELGLLNAQVIEIGDDGAAHLFLKKGLEIGLVDAHMGGHIAHRELGIKVPADELRRLAGVEQARGGVVLPQAAGELDEHPVEEYA